jgi:hypothetical protein
MHSFPAVPTFGATITPKSASSAGPGEHLVRYNLNTGAALPGSTGAYGHQLPLW